MTKNLPTHLSSQIGIKETSASVNLDRLFSVLYTMAHAEPDFHTPGVPRASCKIPDLSIFFGGREIDKVWHSLLDSPNCNQSLTPQKFFIRILLLTCVEHGYAIIPCLSYEIVPQERASITDAAPVRGAVRCCGPLLGIRLQILALLFV
jgi:hypothetical protein